MALPKIQHPTFEVTVPSTKKKSKFRAMLVKEEKILLMAKQAEDRADQLNSVVQVINNCAMDGDFKVEELAMFDLEYIFLKIRANSVSNIAKLAFRDNDDEKTYNFEIDLNKIEVQFDKDVNTSIEVSNGIILQMKYPNVSMYLDKNLYSMDDDKVFDYMLRACMDKIIEGDSIHICKDANKDELEEFIDSIPSKAFDDIQEFLSNMPSMYHSEKYKNANGDERTIEFRTLEDFFML